MAEIWIADVEGVFTDFRALPNQKAIGLSAQIGSMNHFCYVTGRGAFWLEQNILPILGEAYQRFLVLLPVICCAEYGGVILRYSRKEKNWQKELNSFFPAAMLSQLREKVRSLVESIPGVFFDHGKQITISVEAQHSMRDTQPDVVEGGLMKAERILQEEAAAHSDALECQRTTYACDLIPRGMNKAFGASYILEHIGFIPHCVHLLGDAPSDLMLADPIIERQITYTMHYVGDPSKISPAQKKRYSISFPKSQYDQGTREILESFI